MFNQQYPNYMQNINQMQIPPCMRSSDNLGMNPMMMEPESTMPEYQLEMMYPQTYHIIYPEVIRHCDMFDKECCSMKIPTHEEIERMIDNIVIKVEVEVENNIKVESRDNETRQLGFVGRGLLRDFAGALLLREFFDRRHRPHHPRRHFPHHMGY